MLESAQPVFTAFGVFVLERIDIRRTLLPLKFHASLHGSNATNCVKKTEERPFTILCIASGFVLDTIKNEHDVTLKMNIFNEIHSQIP
jgi:hypothetical protein